MEFDKNESMKNITKHQLDVKRAKENIVPPKQMKKIIRNVLNDLSRTVKPTLGPAGGNTLITEPYASVPIYPCKDGFTVMNDHIYDNPVYESIYRVARDISGRTNQELGDGTTTCSVNAANFYCRIEKYVRRHREITPYGIKNIIDTVHSSLTKKFKEKYIIKINDLPKASRIEIYRKIATIAANNDSSIGDMIAEVYDKSRTDEPYINIQKSYDENTIVETDIGFEMPYGYNLSYMANSADGITAEYDNPMFLLVRGPLYNKSLDYLKMWIKWVTEDPTHPRPLVIIAEAFSQEILDYLTLCRTGITRNYNGQRVLVKLPILSICLNMSNEYGSWRVEDLEATLGAKALKTNNGNLIVTPSNAQELDQMLGRAEHVESKFGFTRIRGGAGDMELRKGRIEEIKKIIANNKDSAQHGIQAVARLDMLRHRISMLEGEMQIIKVGGDSEKEKRNRKLIFDDATCAVKACVNNGIILGGQVNVMHCINRYKNELIEDIYNELTVPGQVKNIGIRMNADKLRKIIADILDITAISSTTAFRTVFENGIPDKRWIKNLFKEFYNQKQSEEPKTYNLITDKYEQFHYVPDSSVDYEHKVLDVSKLPDLIVPGNTDIETLKSEISILSLFLTSNQLMSVMVDERPSGR